VIHPDFLLDQLSSHQLAEWEAMDRIDPIGEWVEEFRFARLQSLILTIALKWAAGKNSVDPVDVLDFMPDWLGEREPKKQTVAQMKDILLGLAKEQNKRVANQAKKKIKQLPNAKHRINDSRARNEVKRSDPSRESHDEHVKRDQSRDGKDHKEN
jgi:hypothetical protein